MVLVATQLLVGSGGSLYVCFAHDGVWCCIDAGPNHCQCCNPDCGEPRDACCMKSDLDVASSSGCPHRDTDHFSPHPSNFGTDDSCECTHIPVLIAASQPLAAPRSSGTVAEELAYLVAACLPTAGGTCDAALIAHGSAVPPAFPDFALTVISTVVIRC
jgi:hypothetical protein